MNRLSSVEVTRPPRMTTAMGCSISLPGILPAITKGTRASPVVVAVIKAVDPSWGLDELPLLVFLWVLTHAPDVAVVILREEGELKNLSPS